MWELRKGLVMSEAVTNELDDAVREMERTIYRAVEGAICVFQRRTGLHPCEIEVLVSPYGRKEAPQYELDVVRCHLPNLRSVPRF